MSLGGSKPQQQGPSAQEKVLVKDSIRDWNTQMDMVEPAIDTYLSKTGDRQYASDRVVGEGTVKAANALVNAGQDASLMNATIGRGSGVSGGNTVQLGKTSDAYSDVVGQLRGQGNLMARERDLAGKLKMISYGRGLADASTQNMAKLGMANTQNAIDTAKAKVAEGAALTQGLSSALGMYTAGSKLFE